MERSSVYPAPIHHPTATHVMNVVAIAAAPVSFWVQAAPIVTVLVGCAGLCWYIYQGLKELNHYLKRHKKKPPKD